MTKMTMKRQAGFSLIELMISVALLVLVVGATLRALMDAQHANEAVVLMADTQANMRAAMNFMVRDITQSGDGLPQGGITYPQGGGALPINQPGPPGAPRALVFPPPAPQAPSTTIQVLTAGPAMGPAIPAAAPRSDMVTVMYADNTLVNANGAQLNSTPINSATCPAGAIASPATAVAFDPNVNNCMTITGPNGINVGDLMMFQNVQGVAMQFVSVVNAGGNSLTFNVGDPYNLNGQEAAAAGGTMAQLRVGGVYPPTTATRVWMVTYYLDNTNPNNPQLMRQINFNPPTPIGQGIEGLQISYGINNPLAAYGAAGPQSAKQPLNPDGVGQIRDVNLFLAAKSDTVYSQTGQFFRDNMVTKICVRSLSYRSNY